MRVKCYGLFLSLAVFVVIFVERKSLQVSSSQMSRHFHFTRKPRFGQLLDRQRALSSLCEDGERISRPKGQNDSRSI